MEQLAMLSPYDAMRLVFHGSLANTVHFLLYDAGEYDYVQYHPKMPLKFKLQGRFHDGWRTETAVPPELVRRVKEIIDQWRANRPGGHSVFGGIPNEGN